ncbi:MAG: beta-ketoacyl-[acyl-carrier-protein] synthase family protein [Bacteroidota bacterium]
MENTIYITGIGIISAIGNNVSECLDSLMTKRSGINDIKILQTIHKNSFKVGEVKLTNEELMNLLNIPSEKYSQYTRTSLLGIIAAKEALFNSKIDINDGYKTAFISSSTVGGMDKTELHFTDDSNSSGFVNTHPCGDSTDKIADYLELTDYRTTISTACSSAANAMMHAARLIKSGIADRAIVGGVDALSKFTLNGFNSLMILDTDYCKPFDSNRRGLNIGEGAGFLVLESDKLLKSKNKSYICKLTGYANANDAYHQTASSPEGDGAFSAMTEAIKMSGLNISEIDYVNAHGTGTSNNDLSEGTALKRIFGNNIPKFSSTKSYTGHTLAAAAAVEAVFSCLSIANGIIYPNLNFSSEIPELGISPETELIRGLNIKHVLSNSFGFGGNNSTLIFSK